jgi:hypothetical protein
VVVERLGPLANRISFAVAASLVLGVVTTAQAGEDQPGRQGVHSAFQPSSNRAAKVKHVKFYTPTRNIYCGMFDNGSPQSLAGCEMLKPPAIADVFANGRVLIRRGARAVGNPGEGDLQRSAHLLPYGSSATAGRFRCKSAPAGVACVVIKTGRGIFISKQSVKAVGRPPSPTTAQFYSVPGWSCLMFSSGISCQNVTRGWETDLSPSGAVAICTAATDACHTGAHTGQGIPTIKVGQQVTVQPFRCSYAANGLTCTVIKTGVGFLLTTSGATEVG